MLESFYLSTRRHTLALCEPLVYDDHLVQSAEFVSPPKWHLAHTTWFFETFVLSPHRDGYRPFHPSFHFLFNSYYEALGAHHERPRRGCLSRPTLEEVHAYRAYVDDAILQLLRGEKGQEIDSLVELGLHHEQQHQELLLTDAKHILYSNPLKPAYRAQPELPPTPEQVRRWLEIPERLTEIGHDGRGFSFDNERPRHRVLVETFSIRSSCVTNREYLEFIEDGGYQSPKWWLSDGWDTVRRENWRAPFYWEKSPTWRTFTLADLGEVAAEEPVRHVSYFEADAFARWAGARLATESEWELAYPALAETDPLLGKVWEWTGSPYIAYPGFRPSAGALSEYNGKFMCNQFVLRGGCLATPKGHARPTYRNFFPPEMRWQFSGIRLAKEPQWR